MKTNNNVVLCGFMGSGKTTVGRLLAQRLGRRFVDLDELIAQAAGQSIAEIFKTRGEPYFRALETKAAKQLSGAGGSVISCGGGTVLNPENAALLRTNGKLIYLAVRPETVLARLRQDVTRPLLAGDEAQKKQRITALLAQREPLYRAAADFTVCANGSPEQTVQAIIKIFS